MGNFKKKKKKLTPLLEVVAKTLGAAKLGTTWTNGTYWIFSFDFKSGVDNHEVRKL